MKIQKLHIYNIASIVDATIDFAAAPLCDSDVYLITGDTGAGKTTILDSICMALFNTTPRLAKCKRVKIQTDKDEIALNDTRRLMRRNTGEARVELFFESKGANYKVEWHVQRGARKNAQTSLDQTDRSFVNLDTNQVIATGKGSRDDELQTKICEVIGLDFDQFCRTTMLAQNEFTKFLASDENKRAEILEKITQTSIFSTAGSKIYEITREKETAWKDAKEKANDTGLTDIEIAERQQKIERLSDEATSIQTQRDIADTKRDWLAQEIVLAKDEATALAEFNNANAVLESDEYKNNLTFVNEWNDSIDARDWLEDKIAAECDIKKQEQNLENLKDSFVTILNGHKYASNVIDQLENEFNDINKYLDGNADKAETFANAQTISSHLNAIVTSGKMIKDFEDKKEKAQKDLEDNLKPTCSKIKGQHDDKKKELAAADALIGEKETQLNNLNIKAIRDQRDEAKELMHKIDIAAGFVKAIHDAQDKYNQEAERLSNWASTIAQQQKELDTKLIPEYEQALRYKNACEATRDALHQSVDQFAKNIRSTLTIGCECPVCRQKIAQLPVEAELDKVYQQAELEFQNAKTACEDAEGKKNKAESQLKTDQQRYVADKAKHESDTSVEQAKQVALDACKGCGVDSISDNTVQALETLKASKDNYIRAELDPKIEEGDVIEAKLKELRDSRKGLESSFNKLVKLLDTAEDNVQECELLIKNYDEQASARQMDKDTALASAKLLIADVDWNINWIDDPTGFNNELTTAAGEYAAKTQRKGDLELSIVPRREDNNRIDSIIQEIGNKHSDWKGLCYTEPSKVDDLFSKANSVLHNLGNILTTLNNAKETYQSKNDSLVEFLTQHPSLSIERLQVLNAKSSIKELAETLEKQRQAPEQKKAVYESAKANHHNHQEKRPEINDGDTIESLNQAYTDADDKIKELNQQIGGIQQVLEEDATKKNNIQALREVEASTRAEYERWKRLNDHFGDKEGKVFRTIAQSCIFEGLLNSANTYLQKLEPRYTLKTVAGGLYSALEDAHQGFASRDTGSLSGGESFLVSLALALALSDIGQGLSVDTLFIDEGFGSLSGQPLTNAINTLRSLRGNNGRHVGIISHIQEVRDNIPVQIQVNKATNGSSNIKIVE